MGSSQSKCWILLAIALFASSAFAGTREVGSGQQYSTIQACLNDAQAGDICNVHQGTYNESVSFPRSGSSGSVITLRANPGDTVNVTSGSNPVVNINGKSYVTVDGLNITYSGSSSGARAISSVSGSPNGVTVSNNSILMQGGSGEAAGIYINNTDGAVISGNTVQIAASVSNSDGMNFYKASNIKIDGNTIFGSATDNGSMQDGIVISGTNLDISNNVMHDGWDNGHPDGIVIQGDGDRNGNNTANVKVHGNTLWNFSQCVYVDAIHNNEGEVLVFNNVIYEDGFRYEGNSNKVNGMTLDGENLSGSGWNINVKVYNNTLAAKQLDIYILRLGGGSKIDIQNNLFVNPPYAAVTASSTSGVTMNNDYFSGGNSTIIKYGGSALSLSGARSNGLEANGASGSAGLNADFTPTATSDILGRGANLSAYFNVDKAGLPRPATGAWDVGAYQVGDGTTPAAPDPPQGLQIQVH